MRSDNKRIIQCALLLVSLFLTACGSGGGGTTQPQLATPAYFVSPSGSNSNPGTLAQPWQTLSYAVTKLKAGDTLYARAGDYAETVRVGNSGTATSPITITAYPGESPIIDANGLPLAAFPSILSLQGNYIHASGFEMRNINLNGAVSGGVGVSILGTNDIVSNIIVHHTWSQGITAQGDNSIVQDSTIYNVALANCRLAQAICGITATTYGSALYPSAGWPGCVSATQPYNSGLINHNSAIQRVTVYDCWGEGISTYNSNGTIIQDNITYNNFSENLYVNNAVNALVQRNIVYNAPDSYLGSYTPTAGFALADEQNNTLPSPASNLGANNTVINNFIYNSVVSLYSWTQVSGSGLNNDLIANNTIINSNFATGAGGSHNITNKHSIIANNIVSSGTVTVPSASGLTFSHNLWLTTPPANASGTGDVIEGPQLAATGNTGPRQLSASYFKLLATSPAIGKGMSLTQVPTDFFGTSRKHAPVIGGYESP